MYRSRRRGANITTVYSEHHFTRGRSRSSGRPVAVDRRFRSLSLCRLLYCYRSFCVIVFKTLRNGHNRWSRLVRVRSTRARVSLIELTFVRVCTRLRNSPLSSWSRTTRNAAARRREHVVRTGYDYDNVVCTPAISVCARRSLCTGDVTRTGCDLIAWY